MRAMLQALVFVLVAILAAHAACAGELVKKVATDDLATIGTVIAIDPRVKIDGRSSLKITTRWPTVICLDVVPLDLDDARLVYRAKARCEGLEGTAMLEMWCRVKGGEFFSRGMNSVVTGTMDWSPVETPFLLQKGQKAEKATLNLVINGKGTVWVGGVRLEREPAQ